MTRTHSGLLMPDPAPSSIRPPRLGVDIVHVPRFADKTLDSAFVRRILTDEERALLADGPRLAARLAGQWAAKEAVAKALGCGFGADLVFHDVEILRDEHRAPWVRLSDAAAARHGHPAISISITHDGEYAAAVAAVV